MLQRFIETNRARADVAAPNLGRARSGSRGELRSGQERDAGRRRRSYGISESAVPPPLEKP
jgi:hypothetical protein